MNANKDYLISRLIEPSTWSGLASLFMGIGIVTGDIFQIIFTVVSAVAAGLGMALPEKGERSGDG